MTEPLLQRLRSALPAGRLSTDAADLAANTLDRSGWVPDGPGPIGVVLARDAADVQATMRWATEHGLRYAPDPGSVEISTFDEAAKASLAITRARVQPAIQAIVDATVLRAIDAAEGTGFAARGAGAGVGRRGGDLRAGAGAGRHADRRARHRGAEARLGRAGAGRRQRRAAAAAARAARPGRSPQSRQGAVARCRRARPRRE